MMVGSSGGKIIVNSGKGPCGVCGKGLQANSVQWCAWCGDLSPVADGFRCRRCDGTIQEVDLAKDLMVDGETYECVRSFCYRETLLMEMVERILLIQLESEMDR